MREMSFKRALGVVSFVLMSASTVSFGSPVHDRQVVYHGGPILSHVRAYAVMWGKNVNPTVVADIGPMVSAMLNSTFMDQLSQYDTTLASIDGQPGTQQKVGRGSLAGVLTIDPSTSRTSLSDSDVGAEIEHQINLGVIPEPDENTLFLTFFPKDVSISIEGATSCQAYCAYHHSYELKNGRNIFFAVFPDIDSGRCPSGCYPVPDRFDSVSAIVSHEVAEAITNPQVKIGPGLKMIPESGKTAWLTDEGSQSEEIGDICQKDGVAELHTPEGKKYILQREFDRLTMTCPAGPFVSNRSEIIF